MKMTKKQTAATHDAVAKLSAIAHQGRLSLVRILIQAGPAGLAAGELAAAAAIAPSTASAQLLVLGNAGLLRSERQGRSVRYFANYPAMLGLVNFLMEDCCQSGSANCLPLPEAW